MLASPLKTKRDSMAEAQPPRAITPSAAAKLLVMSSADAAKQQLTIASAHAERLARAAAAHAAAAIGRLRARDVVHFDAAAGSVCAAVCLLLFARFQRWRTSRPAAPPAASHPVSRVMPLSKGAAHTA
jgi:hypothetical protein